MGENGGALISELSALMEHVPGEQRPLADAMLGELAFMADTLAALRAHVAEHGAVEWFANGKQQMWRESPALKSYNATIKRFSDTAKALMAMAPKAEAGDAAQALKDFCSQAL